MASLWIDLRDIKFQLFEVLKIEETLLGKGRYKDYDADTCKMVLDQAAKFSELELAPTYPDEVHRKPVEATFDKGKVTTPESYKRLWKLYCEAGYMATADQPEVGGQGFPAVIAAACANMFLSCNQAFIMYPGLSHGAARLMEDFFKHPLRDILLEKMYSGEWAGTMCLTEPGAGSDVGLLKTTAKKNADGTYSIVGTKSFISAGDHDLTPNIIHPVLARIEGDPPGTKGISIFMVPKIRFNEKGELLEPNDVQCGNIESKMGIHGNATCTLNFGTDNKCIGYLMGEEREGMPIMFHMMNEERQGVGMMGASLAGAAYLHALDYAKQRVQGANVIEMAMKVENPKPVTIINHPDVRRMLLKQKAIAEGCRLLCFFCYFCMDNEFNAMIDKNEEQQAYWHGFIELLTPIVKAYSTDMGMEACQLAVQTYGGYGFCREYPVEQMMRDQKINQIYEGTNGIQALDLLGRKLGMKKGLYFMNLMAMINETIAEGKKVEALKKETETVEKALNACAETSMAFAKMIKTTPYVPLIGACDFLTCMGDVIVGWLQLKQALVAVPKFFAAETSEQDKAFYRGKIEAARFFIGRITDMVPAKLENLKKDEQSCMNIPEESFAV
ncbi:MAG TPA: acyl-CoA dehydrogenase [Smithella sp.]|nr:acyl-CoA dehydrogenase [Smithella sp.]MDM7987477.1 acyl-CoA dehydrogenase [Smithella sp.]HNY50192.1 acyl-CoA dehydrogenase [Smithella sp.]HOG89820.1 acyl-CoA dehydrogenase [Smithella sp.]HQG65159.1 acyl-CoA dehydrogenase [Smithella sp.]